MKENQNKRDRQNHMSGAHPSTMVNMEAAERLGYYMIHGGCHPNTKSQPSKEELRKKKKQQRQARARRKK